MRWFIQQSLVLLLIAYLLGLFCGWLLFRRRGQPTGHRDVDDAMEALDDEAEFGDYDEAEFGDDAGYAQTPYAETADAHTQYLDAEYTEAEYTEAEYTEAEYTEAGDARTEYVGTEDAVIEYADTEYGDTVDVRAGYQTATPEQAGFTDPLIHEQRTDDGFDMGRSGVEDDDPFPPARGDRMDAGRSGRHGRRGGRGRWQESPTTGELPLPLVESTPVAPEPVVAEPVAPEPVAAEPVAPEPVAPEPVAPEPVAAAPIADERVTAEPSAADEEASEAPVGDDLTRIDGVAPSMAAALKAAGLRTFRDVAHAQIGELRTALRDAGLQPTFKVAYWPLAASDLALASASQTAALPIVEPPRPAPAQPAELDAAAEAAEPDPAPEAEPTDAAEPDPEPTDAAEPEPEPTDAAEPDPAEQPPAAEHHIIELPDAIDTVVLPEPATMGWPRADDLQRVDGITMKIASALRDVGIITYEDLAAAPHGWLRSALSASGLRFVPSLQTWGDQARLLAAGDDEGLAALQARLAGGRQAGVRL